MVFWHAMIDPMYFDFGKEAKQDFQKLKSDMASQRTGGHFFNSLSQFSHMCHAHEIDTSCDRLGGTVTCPNPPNRVCLRVVS